MTGGDMNKWVVVAAGFIAAVALAGSAQAQSWCKPGAKLDVIWKGVWYPATAKAAEPGGCLIGYDGFAASWDERVGSDRAGPRDSKRPFATPASPPPGSSNVAAAEAAEAVPLQVAQVEMPKLGPYSCFVYMAGSGLRTRAGFTLEPGGRYRHDFGTSGGFAVKSGVVEFTDGPLDGQAGKLDQGMIRLYNENRSAMITDCEPN